MIRTARRDELPRLQDIEVAAGAMFRSVGMDAVADDPPPELNALAAHQRAGRIRVAIDAAGLPVAYLVLGEIDGWAHIDQVTVHPTHAGQGLGRSLIREAARLAAADGLHGLTLTTFRDVPWNAPYYARLGFTEVAERRWSEGIRRVVTEEDAHGLNRWPRVVMAMPASAPPAADLGAALLFHHDV
jgi:GNAT superfamily N-acetyltransferase